MGPTVFQSEGQFQGDKFNFASFLRKKEKVFFEVDMEKIPHIFIKEGSKIAQKNKCQVPAYFKTPTKSKLITQSLFKNSTKKESLCSLPKLLGCFISDSSDNLQLGPTPLILTEIGYRLFGDNDFSQERVRKTLKPILKRWVKKNIINKVSIEDLEQNTVDVTISQEYLIDLKKRGAKVLYYPSLHKGWLLIGYMYPQNINGMIIPVSFSRAVSEISKALGHKIERPNVVKRLCWLKEAYGQVTIVRKNEPIELLKVLFKDIERVSIDEVMYAFFDPNDMTKKFINMIETIFRNHSATNGKMKLEEFCNIFFDGKYFDGHIKTL